MKKETWKQLLQIIITILTSSFTARHIAPTRLPCYNAVAEYADIEKVKR